MHGVVIDVDPPIVWVVRVDGGSIGERQLRSGNVGDTDHHGLQGLVGAFVICERVEDLW